MRSDLLVQILNMMPPEELGKLISQIQNPQAYLSNQTFGQQEGYRGNLPVQMRGMHRSGKKSDHPCQKLLASAKDAGRRASVCGLIFESDRTLTSGLATIGLLESISLLKRTG